jgi:beta-lactamase class A
VADLALDKLTGQLDAVGGTVSVWCGQPGQPPAYERLADETHYAASTMKLPLLLAAYRLADAGRLDLDERVRLHADFTSAADGSPFEMSRDYDSDDEPWTLLGHEVPLRWLARHMVVRSSNLATNLVLERVGADRVAEAWQVCGAERSVTVRGIEDYAAERAGLSNLVTAADLAAVLGAIADGTPASPSSCAEMLAALADNENRDNVPAGLPAGTYVAHKDGWVDNIAHDAALVRPSDAPPYVLVVCSSAALSEAAGWRLIADVARASWSDRHALGRRRAEVAQP